MYSSSMAESGVLVEVLIPVRGSAPWFRETLDGLSRQTFTDWQLTVLVHGPDLGISDSVVAQFPDAQILHFPESTSFASMLNAGLRACSAPYVARLDADDIPLPNRLREQVQLLSENPDALVACSPVSLIDEKSTLSGQVRGPGSPHELFRGLRWKCVVAHPSVMLRRTRILEIGGYNQNALHVEDYELWLRVAAHSQIVTLEQPATLYRLHDEQVTRTKVISRDAMRLVARARMQLAVSRGESILLARLRQMVWSSRQISRKLGARSH